MPTSLRKCFWVVVVVVVPLLVGLVVVFVACISLLVVAPSSDSSSASTVKPLLPDAGAQDVPIGQLNSPLVVPSSAGAASFVDNDSNNDGQVDGIPDPVAIVLSAFVLMGLAGYSLFLDTRGLRMLGRIYHPTLERPG